MDSMIGTELLNRRSKTSTAMKQSDSPRLILLWNHEQTTEYKSTRAWPMRRPHWHWTLLPMATASVGLKLVLLIVSGIYQHLGVRPPTPAPSEKERVRDVQALEHVVRAFTQIFSVSLHLLLLQNFLLRWSSTTGSIVHRFPRTDLYSLCNSL